MANRALFPVQGTNVPGCKLLHAQVLPNGTSTPTVGEDQGNIIASVSRSGVGVYVITLNDAYLAAGVFPSMRLATAADSICQVTSFTVATTKILTTTILTAGVAADIAANAGNIIDLFFFVRDGAG